MDVKPALINFELRLRRFESHEYVSCGLREIRGILMDIFRGRRGKWNLDFPWAWYVWGSLVSVWRGPALWW